MHITRWELVAAFLCKWGFPTWHLEMAYNPGCVQTHRSCGYGYLKVITDTSDLRLTAEIVQDEVYHAR